MRSVQLLIDDALGACSPPSLCKLYHVQMPFSREAPHKLPCHQSSRMLVICPYSLPLEHS